MALCDVMARDGSVVCWRTIGMHRADRENGRVHDAEGVHPSPGASVADASLVKVQVRQG